jgi:competence protein ComEC
MRWLLLAFALGVLALQQQAELPSTTHAAAVALAIALAAAIASRSMSARSVRVAHCLMIASAAVAVGLGGFDYAAWRAQVRLADELPAAWEGRDIDVVGVVDELPQVAARGTRLAFAVERVVTPGAVVPSRLSLGWYGSWRDDDDAADVPEVHAGERWQLTVRL